jgi:hypothetical protein
VKPNIGGVRSGRSGNLAITGVMEAIEKALRGRGQVAGLITEMAGDVDVTQKELKETLDSVLQRLDALENLPAAHTPAPKPAQTSRAAKAAEKTAAEKAAEEK